MTTPKVTVFESYQPLQAIGPCGSQFKRIIKCHKATELKDGQIKVENACGEYIISNEDYINMNQINW